MSGKELTEKESFSNSGLISNWIQYSEMLIRSREQNWELLDFSGAEFHAD